MQGARQARAAKANERNGNKNPMFAKISMKDEVLQSHSCCFADDTFLCCRNCNSTNAVKLRKLP